MIEVEEKQLSPYWGMQFRFLKAMCMRLSSEDLYSAKEIFEALLLELNGSEKELKNWLFW
jgi:hypothetical protein